MIKLDISFKSFFSPYLYCDLALFLKTATMDKALIIGHSHLKYFHEYTNDSDTKVLSYSGCLVEDLLTFKDVKTEVKSSRVSYFYSLYICRSRKFYGVGGFNCFSKWSLPIFQRKHKLDIIAAHQQMPFVCGPMNLKNLENMTLHVFFR